MMKFSSPRITIASAIAMLSACANPAASIKPEIESFKKQFPNHIETFSVQDKPVQFAWSGDPTKRPVIFVHGSPGSWEGWVHFLLDPELQKNFHLIAVDRPGYGGSNQGVTEPSLSNQAAMILSVLDLNQSKLPAILVGHSFGGPVIAKAAMESPQKIAGLIFVASSVDPELETTKWIQIPASWWPIRELIPSALKVCNEEILPLKQELILLLPQWKKIRARSILIQGEDDELVPPGNLNFLVKNLNSKTVVKVIRVPGLNHFVPWKRPDLILDNLKLLASDINRNGSEHDHEISHP